MRLLDHLDHLDAYGTDDPDFREGHPEDRCPGCGGAVTDHPTWRHRWWALIAILTGGA